MADDGLLETEIDTMEKRGINRYKAVLMAAQEARFIADQIRLGIQKPREKASTMALRKLFDGRIVESEDTGSEV